MLSVAVIVHAAGEHEFADRAGAVNPAEAIAVNVTVSMLRPGQPFSAVVVMVTALPVLAPGTATTADEFDASASQGTVFPKLLKLLPV